MHLDIMATCPNETQVVPSAKSGKIRPFKYSKGGKYEKQMGFFICIKLGGFWNN